MLSGESLSDLYDRDCQWFRDKIAHETGCQDVSVRWLGPAFTLFANSAFIVSELARDSAASTCRIVDGLLGMVNQLEGTAAVFGIGNERTQSVAAAVASRWRRTAAPPPKGAILPSVSIIVVDRLLDLACCVGHNGTVVDRLMQTLYRASETSTDVTLARIREVPRWCCEGDTSESGLRFVGGVLQQSPADLVEVLLHRAPKSALKTLRQMLIRAISTEKGSAPLDRQLKMGNVKPGDLDAILNVLRGPPGAMERNWPLFLLVSAVAESFATVRESSWDRLLSLEKVVIATASENVNALSLLVEFLDSSYPSNELDQVSLDNILIMALFCVSLTGSVPSPDDVLAIRFRERLCVAIRRQAPAEGSVLHSFLDGKNPEWRTQDDQLDRAVATLYQRLIFVAEARNDLSMYRHRIVNLEVPTYQGLLDVIIHDFLDPRAPMADLTPYPTSANPGESTESPRFPGTVGGFISSKIDKLGRVTKARRPDPDGTLIIFVIGGISCAEITRAREILAQSQASVDVLVGGTDIATGKSVLRDLLIT
ncbi:hypothetical protein PBRA_002965 [Plasmodiophora brassicae]|nr:hypothetical protein PBRA_002965 [Plasmodiophora brassicae]